MILFLIKSTLALGLLYGMYHFLLSRESIFKFNRFYLLTALVFSLVLPFIQMPQVIPSVQEKSSQIWNQWELKQAIVDFEEAKVPSELKEVQEKSLVQVGSQENEVNKSKMSWVQVIIAIYFFGLLLFSTRFLVQLIGMRKLLKSNSQVDKGNYRLVLHKDDVLPFSFLHYIFVSKAQYQSSAIESEILEHELAHIRQRHSWDILFVEVLKCVFWFNPLLILYKKAIHLNHEFLADEHVLRKFENRTAYQYLLLNKVSALLGYQAMSSAFNFHVTKRRLMMMGKVSHPMRLTFLKLGSFFLAMLLFFTLTSSRVGNDPGFFISEETDGVEKFEKLLSEGFSEEKPFILELQKLNLEDLRQVYFSLNEEERTQISHFPFFDEVTYEELLMLQKEYPRVVTTITYSIPPDKKEIKDEVFDLWKNTKNVELFIDEEERPVETLNQYERTDFAFFEVRETSPKKFLKKPEYSIKLMTHDFYHQKYFETPKTIQTISAQYPNSDQAEVFYALRYVKMENGKLEEFIPKNFEASIFHHLRTIDTNELDFDNKRSTINYVMGEQFSISIIKKNKNQFKVFSFPSVMF
ncbi:M56 family metallopeptidase [Cecembia rubra]|uniref:M56 family metallopeptidase n=1 Tax=Cecembia rubra TaxID=1485585 RepID=UPI0027144C76|nr:M56 family metallopeptidase [Cecembia rubra]